MISFQQIEVFRAVFSEGSVSAAGRRLNLSQPSVSRILAELEMKIGFALFRRGSRGVAPTPEAAFFQREVEATYAALHTLEDMGREIAQRQRGHLSLVVNFALALDLAPRALERMNLLERNVSVTCQCKSSDWIIDFARSGMIRTGIANIERLPQTMWTRMTSATPHMVLLAPDDALALPCAPVPLDQLRDRKIVALTGAVADRLGLAKQGGSSPTALAAEISLGAVTLAERTNAIPIVDAFTAEFWSKRSGMVARPVPDLPQYMLAIFAPSRPQLSLLDEELQAILEEEITRTEEWAETGWTPANNFTS